MDYVDFMTNWSEAKVVNTVETSLKSKTDLTQPSPRYAIDAGY